MTTAGASRAGVASVTPAGVACPPAAGQLVPAFRPAASRAVAPTYGLPSPAPAGRSPPEPFVS
ncbi:hypothetical protein [Micromonospora sp. NPDC048830]|uniref:hypothetical protein n=1 Tax=Micromonospora sp. NPDC048830 TaxID=3364257 RepID=UPI003713F0DA